MYKINYNASDTDRVQFHILKYCTAFHFKVKKPNRGFKMPYFIRKNQNKFFGI